MDNPLTDYTAIIGMCLSLYIHKFSMFMQDQNLDKQQQEKKNKYKNKTKQNNTITKHRQNKQFITAY